MINNLNEMLSGVQSMIDALKVFGADYTAPSEKIATPTTAAESKFASLDQLISETMRDIRKKRK